MDEKTLIDQALRGDNEAFNVLLEPYIKQAHQTAYLLLHDYSLVEDSVQEALIQTYTSLKRFNSERASFKTWFNRIVINCTLKQKRKLKVSLPLHETYATKENSEMNYLLKEEDQFILNSVRSLKEKYQTTIILYYFQELSIEEIGETLNIRQGTVKSRLFTARKILKKQLNSHDLFSSERREWVWKKS
ncbi:RNA polymerase sigma factor [Priestia megaterium]|uniref:RNA polymerase sigma factor n=1 Tax=Priestia megaterium TaxID=1404 RepID=UPI00366AD111